MKLSNEERQALIGFCKTTMHIKDSEGMGYKLAEFALAALTDEPVAWARDSHHGRVTTFSPSVRDEWMRSGAELTELFSHAAPPATTFPDATDAKRRAFIDSLADDTAPQQYESLSTKGYETEVFTFADGRQVELPTLKKSDK